MQYRIVIDAIPLAPGSLPGAPEGSVLVSFPGGHQMLLPQSVLDAITTTGTADPVPVGLPAVSIPEKRHARPQVIQDDEPDIDPDNDRRKICIECGAAVTHIMPSGKCYACAKVRCPTCGAPASRAEMIGQYCPACLRRSEG